MKNTLKVLPVRVFGIIAFIAVFTLSASTCIIQSGGGGKALNSPEALKEYLDSKPANSPDKPIKVSMTINDPMLKSVVDVIKSASKYVSLNITGNALTTIPESAFYGCKMLVSVTIPNGVTDIKLFAFSHCTNLTSVTIPNSVTIIRQAAFSDCTSLTSITIPDSVTHIGFDVFKNCTSLTNVTIPDSVTDIMNGAFDGCTSLNSVTFQGTFYFDILWVDSMGLGPSPFMGDLLKKYLAEGIGTYIVTERYEDGDPKVWTKQ